MGKNQAELLKQQRALERHRRDMQAGNGQSITHDLESKEGGGKKRGRKGTEAAGSAPAGGAAKVPAGGAAKVLAGGAAKVPRKVLQEHEQSSCESDEGGEKTAPPADGRGGGQGSRGQKGDNEASELFQQSHRATPLERYEHLAREACNGQLGIPMVHADAKQSIQQNTFALPGFSMDNEGLLRLNIGHACWCQTGLCQLKNQDIVYFCNCDERGICARVGAMMCRGLSCPHQQKVPSATCLHVQLLQRGIDRDSCAEDTIAVAYLRENTHSPLPCPP